MNARPLLPRLARADFSIIADWIQPGARVLDLGCGDGTLLRYLAEQRQATGYGVEISAADIVACVRNHVNVIQSDLERGLSDFADHAFDYVILSQTIQAMRNTERIVREMLRVGRQGIVTFPNFGYWRNRLQLIAGRMPVSETLPHQWYDTPNIHLCTVHDFDRFLTQHDARIIERVVLAGATPVRALPNLRGSLAIYRFERAAHADTTS